ncbi:TAXI family TRAP transporter solute-binding subunit [Nocardioides marinisabuli]|uniref:TAXI family TRAP transporter solute-binding subunit n=1 Tax=Nocardioides marinisabuli TaxID=419476 RepID=UPI00215573B2|nr:TAXI family TRAP transporter solute-binding subunit [Nocardioides marinisabuli]
MLLEAAGLAAPAVDVRYAGLAESLRELDDGSVEAVLWSGGIPTPAIAALDDTRPLRMLDLGDWAEPMAEVSGYPYRARRAPDVAYAAAGTATIGVPNLLLARPDLADDLAAAVVETLARDAAALVPSSARGVQYLAPPSMIQTGSVPLHPGAAAAYRRLHG